MTTGDGDIEYSKYLKWKREGGVGLDVFVSDGVWLGGRDEARKHEPFVGVAPVGWESEEEVTFFRDRTEVDAFIGKLREESEKAFGDGG